MIFHELVLQNFGVYGKREQISLTPPGSDKPIILFGGLNGGGENHPS